MWSWFTNGNLDTNDGDSIAEGIGQGRVTKISKASSSIGLIAFPTRSA